MSSSYISRESSKKQSRRQSDIAFVANGLIYATNLVNIDYLPDFS